jgi:hypothetical protein
MMAFDLSNYMTAEERIELFATDNPNFRYEVNHEFYKDSNGDTWVIVKTILWRDNSDSHPWVMGLAAENLKTQFAIEKAETSSFARSITNTGKPQFSTTKNGEKAPRANRAEMEKVVPFTPRYGAVGSRSAAVEQVLRTSFDTPEVKAAINKEPIPWSVGDVVDSLPNSTPKPPIACEHGHIHKEGVSAKNQKPYYGYVCAQSVCQPVWAKVTSNGHWYFEDTENG